MSEPTTLRSRRRRAATTRQKLLLTLFGLLLGLAVIGLLEGGLRLFGVGDSWPLEDPYVGFVPGRELFAEQTSADGERVYQTRPEKLGFFNEQSFAVQKPVNEYRVFTLGGSTTAGRPYDDKVSFSTWLRLYLAEMLPQRSVEVVNAGGISYASYRLVVLIKELVRYSPDLFVVYTGHNEFLEERSYAEILAENPLLTAVKSRLYGLRLHALVRRAWNRVQPPKTAAGAEASVVLESEVEARLDERSGLDSYHRDDQLTESIIAHFEYNLRRLIKVARSNGVEILFVRPASNIKDFSPFKSENRASLSAAGVRQFDDLMRRGRQLLADGELGQALQILDQARSIDPDYAEVSFLLGKCHLAMGSHGAARSSFIRAKDLDVAPLRALEALVELVSEVAASENVAVVDLPTVLEMDSETRYGHPILGNEYFLDHVHPRIEIHSRIAEEVIEQLVGDRVLQPERSVPESRQRQIYADRLALLDRRYYAERDLNLAKVLGWAGKIDEAEEPLRRAVEVLSNHPEVRLNLGIVLQRQRRWDEAAKELETARSLDPELAEAHFNLGVVYEAQGRSEEALVALRRAVELRPDYGPAWRNLGVLSSRMRDFDGSVEAWKRVLELRPSAEAYSGLGLAHADSERWEEAEAAFRQSLALEPDNAEALVGLGSMYWAAGRLEEALPTLEDAVRRYPETADAHYTLGAVYRQLGRHEEAEEAFERAVGEAPGHPAANNDLGVLYARQGKVGEAEGALLKALETSPDYADAHFNLGVVYDQAGRPQDARRSVARALELDAENPRYNLAFGMLLFAAGEIDAARRHLVVARRSGADIPAELSERLAIQ